MKASPIQSRPSQSQPRSQARWAPYLQVPFTIGYHPGPTDFWRFTREGIVALADIKRADLPRGGTGRRTLDWLLPHQRRRFAILGSLPFKRLYIPLKAAFSALLYPLKWLDVLTSRSPQSDRIAGGYYVLATKVLPPAPSAKG